MLDTALLRRTAAVVRNRGNVGNAGDLETNGIQRTHGGLATGARSLDAHFEVLHTILLSRFASDFSSNLRSKRGALARALKTVAATGRPGQSIALTVGDRHDGVVKRSVHVRDAFGYVLFDFL